jgi:hypothetical protein
VELGQVARSSTSKNHNEPWEAVPRSSQFYRDERVAAKGEIPRTPWRASAVRPGGKPLQIITALRRTMIPEVFLQTSFRPDLFAPSSSRKRPTEAETARNSLSWTILQGTPLF